ncbi:hypothetical protein [Psychrobacter pygoscelis]|uniref:hypothetical protein n=1 Tax=Psychrobacter pygoscelis TaxID=2488563 RepID=UPI00103ED0AF|nr:hypothetical protein [Psychrobacter pygoscelis]
MNFKTAFIGSFWLVGAFTLAACGGGDDTNSTMTSAHTGGGNESNRGPIVNKELKYTTYDIYSDVVNDKYKSAWGKLKYSITEDGVREEISTVVGSTPYKDTHNSNNEGLDYYAGDNFFIATSEDWDNASHKLSFVDHDTYKLKITSDKASITSNYDVLSYDISGAKKLPDNAKTGIRTDLHYPYFPANVTFPKGSQCYILAETPEQSYYSFYSTAERDDITLDQWLANKKKENRVTNDGIKYNYQVNNLVKEKVGQKNSLNALRFTDQYGKIHAAIEFNGLVYNADYLQKGVKEKIESDPKTQLVNCRLYNDIAADFIEKQIKANYK